LFRPRQERASSSEADKLIEVHRDQMVVRARTRNQRGRRRWLTTSDPACAAGLCASRTAARAPALRTAPPTHQSALPGGRPHPRRRTRPRSCPARAIQRPRRPDRQQEPSRGGHPPPRRPGRPGTTRKVGPNTRKIILADVPDPVLAQLRPGQALRSAPPSCRPFFGINRPIRGSDSQGNSDFRKITRVSFS
jgi:hypothetical protein